MIVELAQRENDGVHVALLWSTESDSLSVAVHDSRTSDAFELVIGEESSVDVFYHPYAYAAFRGIDYAEAA
jgi:hypothetical protein